MIVRPDSTSAAPVPGGQASHAQPPELVTVLAEVAPGQMAEMQVPREAIDRYGLVKMMRLKDGTVRPIMRTWSSMMRITRDLPRQLGLDMSVHTLHVLVRSGLVRGSKPAPSTTLIDVDSLMRHIQQTTGERARDYWTAERHRQYQEAYTAYHQRSDGMTTRQPHARRQPPAAGVEPPPPARVARPAPRPRSVDSTPDLFDFPDQ